jgi:predicted secreted protein
MSPFTAVIVYLLIWWTVLFAVLPIGTQPEPEADPDAGGWRGVPKRPLILRKLAITTLVSALIWVVAYALITSDWLSFRSGWLAMPEK